MRKRRNFVPSGLTPMEERLLLSSVVAADVGQLQVSPPAVRLVLHGIAQGTGSTARDGTERLSGRGTIAPLGRVQLTGSVQGPARPDYAIEAEVTLDGAGGKVFVHLFGKETRPGTWASRYEITGGTGRYSHAAGGGEATYTARLDPFLAVSPGDVQSGRSFQFSLKFGD